MGKKKKKNKKKKKGMLATLANAVLHPNDATRNLTSEGKIAGGIELAQLVTMLASLFAGNGDGEDEDDEKKGLRERIEDLVDRRLERALERFDDLRDEVRELAERIDTLEQKVARPARRAAPRPKRATAE